MIRNFIREGTVLTKATIAVSLHQMNGKAVLGVDKSSSHHKSMFIIMAIGECDQNRKRESFPLGVHQLAAKDAQTQIEEIQSVLLEINEITSCLDGTKQFAPLGFHSFHHFSSNHVVSNGVLFNLIKNKEEWSRWHPSFSNRNEANLDNVKTTVLSQNDSLLVMQWQAGNSKPINNHWQLHRMGEGNDFTLQWFINFHSAWYPWQKLKSLFYENNYGKMMEQGLKNIKDEAESLRK